MSADRAPQYMAALETANEVRLARSVTKRKVADGDLNVYDVILGDYPECANMTVSDLLMSQRHWGHTRCRKLLRQVPVSENKRVGDLTLRQGLVIRSLLLPDGLAIKPPFEINSSDL